AGAAAGRHRRRRRFDRRFGTGTGWVDLQPVTGTRFQPFALPLIALPGTSPRERGEGNHSSPLSPIASVAEACGRRSSPRSRGEGGGSQMRGGATVEDNAPSDKIRQALAQYRSDDGVLHL